MGVLVFVWWRVSGEGRLATFLPVDVVPNLTPGLVLGEGSEQGARVPPVHVVGSETEVG